MNHFPHTLLLSALLVLAAACRQPDKSQAVTDQRPTVTVTIEPLRYFADAIGGDRFHIVSMVPRGSSPETYDPTPQQLVDLANSTAYLRAGYIGFEQAWTKRLAANAPQLRFFDTSRGIRLIHGHRHDGHGHSTGVEPHVWTSVRNAQTIARNIGQAFAELDPEGASLYTARTDSLCQALTRTDSLCRALLATPRADRTFLIYHPALSYFARDYGLKQVAIENDGKEPSPAYLGQLIDTCRKDSVRVIFVQPEFDRRNADLIARQTGARVVPINPLSYDWEHELLNVAQALAGTE